MAAAETSDEIPEEEQAPREVEGGGEGRSGMVMLAESYIDRPAALCTEQCKTGG